MRHVGVRPCKEVAVLVAQRGLVLGGFLAIGVRELVVSACNQVVGAFHIADSHTHQRVVNLVVLQAHVAVGIEQLLEQGTLAIDLDMVAQEVGLFPVAHLGGLELF